MSDVYYHPEKFGLETVAELDLTQESYSFDLLVVWRRLVDGQLLFARDAGCSCPAPFEGVGVDDLAEFSLTAVDAILREEYVDTVASEVAAFKEKVLNG